MAGLSGYVATRCWTLKISKLTIAQEIKKRTSVEFGDLDNTELIPGKFDDGARNPSVF